MTDQMLNKLLAAYGLGKCISRPEAVSGGYLHRMFRAETGRGVFAVKALNPEIMARPQALDNMRLGEAAALALAEQVPLCAALEGRVTPVEGRYFMVYLWAEGKSVFPPQITVEHCRAMGDVLGRIHREDITVEGMQRADEPRAPLDWTCCPDENVRAWDAAVVEAQARLLGRQVISHRDLDPKNVLWQGMTPCIIDWEAAGYVNPWQELVELINYWADDEPKARAMIAAYGAHVDLRCADWPAALAASMDGMLGWLHYNLHRAGGEEHVQPTLDELHRYAARMEELQTWLEM